MTEADDRQRQVEPSTLVAFGIRLESRYGRARELVEMLGFATACNDMGLSSHVSAVFYDSKADVCSFTVGPDLSPRDPVARRLLGAARLWISQFEWIDGAIGHGDPLFKEHGRTFE